MARGFGWSSQGRAGSPSYRSVAPLDSAISVVAIALAAFTIVGVAVEPVDKAQFMEALIAASVHRIQVVEHLAVTGRPLATDVTASPGARDAAGPEYERHLSGALAAFTIVAPQSGKSDDDRGPAIRVGVVDGSVIAVGRLRPSEGGYMLPLMPATAPPESGALIAWVCGEAPVPAGRAIPQPRPETRVPVALLPFTCRKGNIR